MYVAQEAVAAWERRYGNPAQHSLSFRASDREIALVQSSQKSGRRHDITMAILGPEGVIVIAKPWYPPGIFRIPSGGLLPGETLEAGAAREALEELLLRALSNET